jgi:hypothetical protein
MAQVIDRDEAQALDLLAAAGVHVHALAAGAGDAADGIVAAALLDGERQVRAEVDIPVPDDVDAGMGAWHVNAVDEIHVVATGQGIMEFVTVDGIVSIVVGAGDIVEIHGAEHRYRPLTEQRWLLRFGGPADGELVATQTGRAAGPWPTV